MKKIALLFIASFSLNSFAAMSVSMVQLISDGDEFRGKTVETFGYMSGIGGPALYLTKDHVGDSASSVLLQITDEMASEYLKCRNRYVSLTGELIGEGGVLYLEDIQSIFDPSSVEFCYKAK